MARFNVSGIWYEATSYKAAREMHQAAQASPASAKATTVVTPPRPVVMPTKPKPPPTNLAQAPLKQPSVTSVPKAVPAPAGGKAFDLVCYRGEKNNWWSPPEERLICGMTLYQPWNLMVGIKTMNDLWQHLQKYITSNCGGKVDAFAQHLRAQGRPFAVATARTTTGSYTSDYNYVIKIPNARTFLWGANLTLGAQVSFADTKSITADYVVLNADTLNDSTVLAFGHKCGTYEVTFLHDLNLEFVESCNNKSINQWPIKRQEDLSFDDKIKLRKYLRRSKNWLA